MPRPEPRPAARPAPITRLALEHLEDRVVPAVTPADLKFAVKQLGDQVRLAVDAVDAAESLGVDLGIVELGVVGGKLRDFLEATNEVSQQINAASQADAADITAYLRSAIPAATDKKVTIPYDDTDVAGRDPNVVNLRLKVVFADAKTNLAPQLEKILGGVKLGVPDGLAFTLTNDLSGYFNLRVTDDGPATPSPLVQFVPGVQGGEASRIEYRPKLNATLDTTGVLAGTLAYKLSGSSVNFAPTFTFGYGPSTVPVSLIAAATPAAPEIDPTSNKLVADVRADLTSAENAKFKLPKFGFGQTYTVTFSENGGTSGLSAPRYYFNNQLIDSANEESVATSVALSVLKDSGVDVVDQLADVLPKEVVDLLLGDFNVGGGYTLKDILALAAEQGAPIDTPLDVLQFFGVPGPVITVAETVLRQIQLRNELNSINPNETNQAVKDAKLESVQKITTQSQSAAKFSYLGQDRTKLTGEILRIFKGERVDLVKYDYDVVNDPTIQALVRAKGAKIESQPNGFGGSTNYIVGKIDINSQKLIDLLVSKLPANVRRPARQLLEFAVKNSGIDFSLKIDLRFAAAFRLGADTTFLLPGTKGSVEQKIAKSIYVSTGNLFDFDLKGSASVSASIDNPVNIIFEGLEDLREQVEKEGGELGRQIGDIARNPGKYAGDLKNKAGEEGQKVLDKVFGGFGLAGLGNLAEASASLNLNVRLVFGVCDPPVKDGANDGRLTFDEISQVKSPSDVFAVGGQIGFNLKGKGQVAGVNLALPPIGFGFDFGKVGGCRPGPNGPALAEFDDGQGKPDGATPLLRRPSSPRCGRSRAARRCCRFTARPRRT